MNESIIGTRISIFDILYECDYKSNDGHKMYRVKCTKCGWETDMQKRHIERVTQCTHLGITGQYKRYDYNWSNDRIGRIFSGMKNRCYNPNEKNYSRYGGRGITICDEWLNNPKLFEEWALLNGYADNLSIDRKNGDKGYYPDNCRWISLEYNAKYKSTTTLIKVDEEIHTGKEWSAILHIGTNTINVYIRKYGLENTIEFIKKYKANPTIKRKPNQNLYKLYMG